MQGSDQSVAFDYQLPAAPLLAPWHELHIRRSDLHRNVSVSIVVSKFTIYRHSRRSPFRKHCSAGTPLKRILFGSLLLTYSIRCCCFFFFLSLLCSYWRGENTWALGRRFFFFFFCWTRWALFMNIDREIRSSVFSSSPAAKTERGARKKKEGNLFCTALGSPVHQKAILFASMWRFFIAVFF